MPTASVNSLTTLRVAGHTIVYRVHIDQYPHRLIGGAWAGGHTGRRRCCSRTTEQQHSSAAWGGGEETQEQTQALGRRSDNIEQRMMSVTQEKNVWIAVTVEKSIHTGPDKHTSLNIDSQGQELLSYVLSRGHMEELVVLLLGTEEMTSLLTLDVVKDCLVHASRWKPTVNLVPVVEYMFRDDGQVSCGDMSHSDADMYAHGDGRYLGQRMPATVYTPQIIDQDHVMKLLGRMCHGVQEEKMPKLESLVVPGVDVATSDKERPIPLYGDIGGSEIAASRDDTTASHGIDQSINTQEITNSRIILPSSIPYIDESKLQFKKVAVGGTFDRLHAGHRLLLGATALVSTTAIFVGVTSDKLLAKKKARHLLQSYSVREASAMEYMKLVNPGVAVMSAPLTDPKVPPLAATDPEFDAIVVSEETIIGAEQINMTRKELGLEPLIIVVVGLLGGGQGRAGNKLSSTDLREAECF